MTMLQNQNLNEMRSSSRSRSPEKFQKEFRQKPEQFGNPGIKVKRRIGKILREDSKFGTFLNLYLNKTKIVSDEHGNHLEAGSPLPSSVQRIQLQRKAKKSKGKSRNEKVKRKTILQYSTNFQNKKNSENIKVLNPMHGSSKIKLAGTKYRNKRYALDQRNLDLNRSMPKMTKISMIPRNIMVNSLINLTNAPNYTENEPPAAKPPKLLSCSPRRPPRICKKVSKLALNQRSSASKSPMPLKGIPKIPKISPAEPVKFPAGECTTTLAKRRSLISQKYRKDYIKMGTKPKRWLRSQIGSKNARLEYGGKRITDISDIDLSEVFKPVGIQEFIQRKKMPEWGSDKDDNFNLTTYFKNRFKSELSFNSQGPCTKSIPKQLQEIGQFYGNNKEMWKSTIEDKMHHFNNFEKSFHYFLSAARDVPTDALS